MIQNLLLSKLIIVTALAGSFSINAMNNNNDNLANNTFQEALAAAQRKQAKFADPHAQEKALSKKQKNAVLKTLLYGTGSVALAKTTGPSIFVSLYGLSVLGLGNAEDTPAALLLFPGLPLLCLVGSAACAYKALRHAHRGLTLTKENVFDEEKQELIGHLKTLRNVNGSASLDMQLRSLIDNRV